MECRHHDHSVLARALRFTIFKQQGARAEQSFDLVCLNFQKKHLSFRAHILVNSCSLPVA